MLVFISSWHDVMLRVEGEAGYGWVYSDEGLCSHFSIIQNPMNGCLSAPGWLQVIACCKHATKLQDCAELYHLSKQCYAHLCCQADCASKLALK